MKTIRMCSRSRIYFNKDQRRQLGNPEYVEFFADSIKKQLIIRKRESNTGVNIYHFGDGGIITVPTWVWNIIPKPGCFQADFQSGMCILTPLFPQMENSDNILSQLIDNGLSGDELKTAFRIAMLAESKIGIARHGVKAQ